MRVGVKLLATYLVLLSFGVLLGVATVALALIPMFLLEGPIEGYVGLIAYHITAFGERVYSPALDAASILSIPVIVSAVMNLIFCSVTFHEVMRTKSVETPFVEAQMASSLTMLSSVGIVAGITRIIASEIKLMTGDFNSVTSAGELILGVVRDLPTFSAHFFGGLTYAALVTAYSIGSAIVYSVVAGSLREKRRGPPHEGRDHLDLGGQSRR